MKKPFNQIKKLFKCNSKGRKKYQRAGDTVCRAYTEVLLTGYCQENQERYKKILKDIKVKKYDL